MWRETRCRIAETQSCCLDFTTRWSGPSCVQFFSNLIKCHIAGNRRPGVDFAWEKPVTSRFSLSRERQKRSHNSGASRNNFLRGGLQHVTDSAGLKDQSIQSGHSISGSEASTKICCSLLASPSTDSVTPDPPSIWTETRPIASNVSCSVYSPSDIRSVPPGATH
jgi:hypothetical protein